MKKLLLLASGLVLLNVVPVIAEEDNATRIAEIEEQIKKLDVERESLSEELKSLKGNSDKSKEDGVYSIGDSVELKKGVILTIDDAVIANQDLNDFDKFNYDAVRIDFTIENKSGKREKITAHDFSLYDGDKIKTDHDSKDYFSEKIDDGMKGQGSIYYDVKNLGELTLKFEEATFILIVE